MKTIKVKKSICFLSFCLVSFCIIGLIPSAVSATIYKYPYYYYNPPNKGECVEGDLNSFMYINDADIIHWQGTYVYPSYKLEVCTCFDAPTSYGYSNEVKIVFKFIADRYLYITVIYYETGSTADNYQEEPTGDSYVTRTYPVPSNRKVQYIYFYTPPGNQKHLYIDYLSVKYTTGGGGGDGCPILSVFNGEEYIEEGLLDIHNPDGIDEIYNHQLITQPQPVNNRFLLRLTEHHKTISYIDRVELWGELSNGKMMKLHLYSAIHSELGSVTSLLWLSDERKVDVLGADHNNGLSQFIDLEFIAPKGIDFNKFMFVIEGNNVIIK